jgi:hypothetical protein
MHRSPLLAPIGILLLLAMFVTGCVGTQSRSFERSDDGASVALAHKGDAAPAEKAHGGDAAAAIFLAGAILIVGAVVVDLLILPYTGPCYHHPFCCTREVVVVCYH